MPVSDDPTDPMFGLETDPTHPNFGLIPSPTPQPTATPQSGEVPVPEIAPSTQYAPGSPREIAAEQASQVTGPVRNAVEAAAETVSSLVPKSVPQALETAASFVPAISGTEEAYKGVRSLTDVLFGGKGMEQATAERFPESRTLVEAEKTPPFSKERFKAGFGTVAQMGMAAAVGKGIPLKPATLTETLFGKEQTPLVEAVNENLSDLEKRYGTQPQGGQVASQEPSTTSVTQPEVRTPVGEGAPLRQQGETPEARQGTEAGTQAPENAVAPQAEVATPNEITKTESNVVPTVSTGEVGRPEFVTEENWPQALSYVKSKYGGTEPLMQSFNRWLDAEGIKLKSPQDRAGQMQEFVRKIVEEPDDVSNFLPKPSPVPATEAATTAAPEIPEGSKATIQARDADGKVIEIKNADAKEWESKFTNERDSYQKLIDCLNA